MSPSRFSAGARALRLLPLASPLLLAACLGGGGGGSASGPSSSAPGLEVTAANQQAVAENAAANTQILNVGPMVINQLVPPTTNDVNRRVLRQMPVAAATAGADSSAALLAAVVRKFTTAARGTQVAGGVAVNETVACDVGSGTITGNETESETQTSYNYSFSGTVTLNNCRTTLETYGTVIMNGSLTIDETSSGSNTGYNSTLSLVANHYRIESEGPVLEIDGDMRAVHSSNDTGSSGSVTGSRLTVSQSYQNAPSVDVSSRTVTLYHYSQVYQSNANGVTTESNAQVETNEFGGSAVSYTLTTVQAVREVGGAITEGKVKIVGARNTSTLVSVTSNNTVKLEADQDGNGTIDATVEGLDAWTYLPHHGGSTDY